MRARTFVGLILILTLGCSDDPAQGNTTNNANNDNNQNNTNNGNNATNNGNNRNNATNQSNNIQHNTASGWFDAAPIAEGARQETAVVAYGGEVFEIGGYNDNGQIVALHEAYDPTSDTWRTLAPTPVPMHHANAAVVGDTIYVLGFLGSGFAADGRVFEYDPQSNSWTPGDDMPDASRRGSSGVGVIDDKVYLVGGLRGGAVSDVSVYDTTTGVWSELAPFSRNIDHMAAGVIAEKLIIAGGRNGSVNGHYPQTEIYDPAVDEWTSGPPIPTARGGVAAAVHNGKLYVFGGEGNGDDELGVFDEVEAFDLAQNVWLSLEGMKTARHGLGAATVDGVIYLPGGATRQLFEAVSTHEYYVPE